MKTRGWFRIHSFTGVITGLLLFVICWSGTFAVLSEEIDWLVAPEVRVESTGERASWGTLFSSVRAAYPDGEVTGITTPNAENVALTAWVNLPDDGSVRVPVDPYTAEVRDRHNSFDVGRFFRDFHTHLFSLGLSQLVGMGVQACRQNARLLGQRVACVREGPLLPLQNVLAPVRIDMLQAAVQVGFPVPGPVPGRDQFRVDPGDPFLHGGDVGRIPGQVYALFASHLFVRLGI